MAKITFLLFFPFMLTAQTPKIKILYVYDPLCGWCYGFTPVMQLLQKKYYNRYDFEIISGGMVTGSREGAITHIAPYISQAYKRVEDMTGIKFGEKFLQELLWDAKYIMSSVKPSEALAAFKHFKPELAIDFAHDIQHAFYHDAKSLNVNSTYSELAAKYSIAISEFEKILSDNATKQLALQEFRIADSLKVQGFPAVFVIINNRATQISSGYTDISTLEKNLQRALKR